jgi:hypothetical protein
MKVFISALLIGFTFIISLTDSIASVSSVYQVSRNMLFWLGACLNAQAVRFAYSVTCNPGGVL